MTGMMSFSFTEPPRQPDGSRVWAKGASRWAAAARPLVRGAIKDKAPIGQGSRSGARGGRLKASITQHTTVRAGSVKLEFGSPLPYVPFVVDGTRPHLIVPRNRRALAFTTNAGGNVFARRVNHPGTRPNHFAIRAVEPLLPALRDSLSAAMGEAFGGQA